MISIYVHYSQRLTALHNAAFKGHKEIVDLLIARGADVNAVDAIVSTILDPLN